ncbi:MAG: SUMF1/EgtB/PvdO family nonheme iron enzyme [Candidatus Thiodiazotropha sp. LLP2]
MSGNVWEWVQDCWHADCQNAPSDGSAWLENDKGNCALRVVRGASWSNWPRLLRSANRNWNFPAKQNGDLGFRLAHCG